MWGWYKEEWVAMNSIDIIIIVVALLFGGLGLYWGFIRQILALVGLIAGVVFASRFGGAAADALSSFVSNEMLAGMLGFVIVLVAISGAASLLASLLQRFAGLLFLGPLDHLIGGLLGLLQGLLACTVFVLLGATFPLSLWMPAVAESRLAPTLVRLFSFLIPLLPESFHLAAQLIFGVP
jgi:membrane protein required for colicin V production